MNPLIALIDIGKSYTKLSLLEAQSGATVWGAKRANDVVYLSDRRQLDVVAIEKWLLDMLRAATHKEVHPVIVPVAHGAAAVLMDGEGTIVTASDYEDPCFDTVDEDYESQRDAFEQTYSPSLPLGLNLGRQFHYLEHKQPKLHAAVRHALPYPQYWSWLLSGIMASEVTSLGCHTDLWRPRERGFSALARRRGWSSWFPPLRFAGDTLGTLSARIAELTGLSRECRVICGLHDSNASFLEHLTARGRDTPFCVVSSGTWTVIMANGANPTKLDPKRDMLANVDAFSSPVCTARFMGGREYTAINPGSAIPNRDALQEVLMQGAMALPSFAPGGPVPNALGRLIHADKLNDVQRAALATLYVVLMSDLSIELLGADGDVFVDGPLAFNPLFAPLLAAWHRNRRVLVGREGDECVRFPIFLSGFGSREPVPFAAVEPLNMADLNDYRNRWRDLLPLK